MKKPTFIGMLLRGELGLPKPLLPIPSGKLDAPPDNVDSPQQKELAAWLRDRTNLIDQFALTFRTRVNMETTLSAVMINAVVRYACESLADETAVILSTQPNATNAALHLYSTPIGGQFPICCYCGKVDKTDGLGFLEELCPKAPSLPSGKPEAPSDNVAAVLQKCSRCETLEARLKRAGEEIRKAVRDWHRFQDFIIGEGPQEYFRLVDAGKQSNGVIEKFMAYLTSLWDERNKLEKLLSEQGSSSPAPSVTASPDSVPSQESAPLSETPASSQGLWTHVPATLSHLEHIVIIKGTRISRYVNPDTTINTLKQAVEYHNASLKDDKKEDL